LNHLLSLSRLSLDSTSNTKECEQLAGRVRMILRSRARQASSHSVVDAVVSRTHSGTGRLESAVGDVDVLDVTWKAPEVLTRRESAVSICLSGRRKRKGQVDMTLESSARSRALRPGPPPGRKANAAGAQGAEAGGGHGRPLYVSIFFSAGEAAHYVGRRGPPQRSARAHLQRWHAQTSIVVVVHFCNALSYYGSVSFFVVVPARL
jgi:hypothetical protein